MKWSVKTKKTLSMKEIKNKKHEHTKELEEISTKDKVLLFTKLNGN